MLAAPAFAVIARTGARATPCHPSSWLSCPLLPGGSQNVRPALGTYKNLALSCRSLVFRRRERFSIGYSPTQSHPRHKPSSPRPPMKRSLPRVAEAASPWFWILLPEPFRTRRAEAPAARASVMRKPEKVRPLRLKKGLSGSWKILLGLVIQYVRRTFVPSVLKILPPLT